MRGRALATRELTMVGVHVTLICRGEAGGQEADECGSAQPCRRKIGSDSRSVMVVSFRGDRERTNQQPEHVKTSRDGGALGCQAYRY